MTRTLWLLMCACLLSSAGCQSLGDMNFFGWGEEKAPTKKPTQLYALWQEGVDVQLDNRQGGMAVPGFAGRVIFQSPSAGRFSETVAVEGTLLVSLYADGPQQNPQQPLETWTIKPEHMPQLLKKDLAGWGYALWLPWNTYNPAIRSGRLTVQFTTKEGDVLRGEPSQLLLQNSNQGGLPKPRVEIQQFQQRTWQ